MLEILNLNFGWLDLARPDVLAYCEKHYGIVGATARALDVRLSMHPGQFVVLASATEEIVERSIEEFEYHADLIRWMGYGKNWQDFKCNVHISGRQGPAGIKAALKRLSPEARNCITIENDENSNTVLSLQTISLWC
jgi:UV DNA damage endonuclease